MSWTVHYRPADVCLSQNIIVRLMPVCRTQVLMDILDNDSSGEVDMDEFISFWKNAPPLRLGDEEQRKYWLQRMVPRHVYAMCVGYHDVRHMYPEAQGECTVCSSTDLGQAST